MDNQFSPPPVDGEIMGMNFPEAMAQVIKGNRITRTSWNDLEEYGILADGWLTIHTKGAFFKWTVNDGDLLAEDWKVI